MGLRACMWYQAAGGRWSKRRDSRDQSGRPMPRGAGWARQRVCRLVSRAMQIHLVNSQARLFILPPSAFPRSPGKDWGGCGLEGPYCRTSLTGRARRC
jgi:hypothetical protein